MLDFQLHNFFYFIEVLELYILVVAIVSYLLLLSALFLLFFFFNLTKVNTLLDIKLFNSYNFFTISILLLFISFAGIPPFLGFLSKFLMFVSILKKNHFLFLLFFTVLNTFMIYFYIQNTRFLVKTKVLLGLAIKTFYNAHNINNFNLFNAFNFFNVFSFLLVDYWILLFANFCIF